MGLMTTAQQRRIQWVLHLEEGRIARTKRERVRTELPSTRGRSARPSSVARCLFLGCCFAVFHRRRQTHRPSAALPPWRTTLFVKTLSQAIHQLNGTLLAPGTTPSRVVAPT